MGVFLYYFGWPHGQVWPNLLAALVCSGVVWWRLRARMIAHHIEQFAQHERHHAEMKAHVTAAAAVAIPRPKTLVRKPEGDGL